MDIYQKDLAENLADKYSLWIEFPDGSKRETDYNEVELILKDIRFIKHELANYSYLYASQLSFDKHLDKNYWEFLNLTGELGQDERDELEEGVLLILYLYYKEIFEAEGLSTLFRKNLFEPINSFLSIYSPNNNNKKLLKDCIQFSIVNSENKATQNQFDELSYQDKKLIEKFNEKDKWIYKTFIEDYFIGLANSFEPARQKAKQFGEWIKRNSK